MYNKTDLLSRKYRLLEEIKLLAEDKSWSKAGRNFLGMWGLVPDGIRRLRSTLRKLPEPDFNILSQEDEINNLFRRTMSTLKRKQRPYRFIGKRLIKTQDFYTEYYEKGLRILQDEPKKEAVNDKCFRT